MTAWWNGTARPGTARRGAARRGEVGLSKAHLSPGVLSVGFGLLGSLMPAAQAISQSIAGISHYEVVVIGVSMDSHELNIAYEVTDCGLVVGQIRREGVHEAFVFASRAQFGLQANELVILPNPVGIGAVAFDVNEQGVVVGAVGDADPEATHNQRAAVWRLASSGTSTSFQVIPPPPDTFFKAYASGGFGRLASVSADENGIWAAGHFRRDADCGTGQFAQSRLGAVAVRLTGSTPVLADYRWDTFVSGASQAYGISRAAEQIAGSHRSCTLTAQCGLLDGEAARAWTLGAGPFEMPATDRHIDPEPATPDEGRSVIRAILDDGSGVGAMADIWLDAGCRRVACAWAPGAGPIASILPPVSADMHVKGSIAHDIEATGFAHQGVLSGRFAVGMRHMMGEEVGVLWFRDDTQGSNWASSSWNDRVPVHMVSCPDVNNDGHPPRCLRITELRGVNRRGDLAGQIEIDGALHPVLLQAVPIACVGDVSHDGFVNASDLAILLGAWCGTSVACPPLSYSDFNLDGRVDAADLGTLLAQWGATPCAGECGSGEIEVPLEVQVEAKSALDFALQYAGLVDLEVYQAWAASVPAELRVMVDDIIWDTTRSLVE